jgi:antitoxin (DNA-binding transcriptional repressor) of toxin-antitoxin stability system
MTQGRRITQRELRNESGKIMRGLDDGESFVVTRNGVPVGELRPVRRRTFVSAEVAVAGFASAPRLALDDLRRDLDEWVGQDVEPRA